MSNSASISGSALTGSAATDPALCRISGYLRGIDGVALRGWGLTVRNMYNPYGQVTNTLFLAERKTFRTNTDGLVEFDLVRGMSVDIELPNRLTDHVIHRTVPDVAQIELVDFLFPYVVSIEFTSPDPESVAIGDSLVLTMTATMSDGTTIELDGAPLTMSSSNDSVLMHDSGLNFLGVAAGSVTVSVDAFDYTKLDILKQPDGIGIELLELPDATLPAPLTVVVS